MGDSSTSDAPNGGGNGGGQANDGDRRQRQPSQYRVALRSSIHSAVDATNSVLASMESTADAASASIASRIQSLGRQLRPAVGRLVETYESRKSYGPQIVAGTAAAVGGAAAMRRGRVPGAFAGLASGAAAYGVVYGVEKPPPPPSWSTDAGKKD